MLLLWSSKTPLGDRTCFRKGSTHEICGGKKWVRDQVQTLILEWGCEYLWDGRPTPLPPQRASPSIKIRPRGMTLMLLRGGASP